MYATYFLFGLRVRDRQREKSPLDSHRLHGIFYGGVCIRLLFCIRVFQRPLAQEKRHRNFVTLWLNCLMSLYLIYRIMY